MRRLFGIAVPLGLLVVLFAQQGAIAALTANVAIKNFAFTPSLTEIRIGDSVKWLNHDLVTAHTTTSDGFDACCRNGAALWKSGALNDGQTFTQLFSAAGGFGYHCSIHTYMTGSVSVLGSAIPRQGNITTVFTITWAATPGVPTGFTEDIQIKRPGSTLWESWLSGQAAGSTSATFTADAGVGNYQFRSRLNNTSLGRSSAWSHPSGIRVS